MKTLEELKKEMDAADAREDVWTACDAANTLRDVYRQKLKELKRRP